MEFKIVLPMPPSLNRLYRMGKGNFYTSSESKLYDNLVWAMVRETNQQNCFTEEDRLRLEIFVHAENNRKFDLDNLIKKCQDSLQFAGVYPNDNQIDELWVQRGEIRKPAEVYVYIRTLDSAK